MGITRLFAFGSGSVEKFQLYIGLLSSLVKPAGMLIHIDYPAVRLPAAGRDCSDLRSADCQHASDEPAPTMM